MLNYLLYNTLKDNNVTIINKNFYIKKCGYKKYSIWDTYRSKRFVFLKWIEYP